jgi:uncharacterized protein YjbJ (UPF0337 family)
MRFLFRFYRGAPAEQLAQHVDALAYLNARDQLIARTAAIQLYICPAGTPLINMRCNTGRLDADLMEDTMDWNRIEGNWKQVKGKVKEKWGALTDDDLERINGQRDQLEGKIQERYGIAKDMVRKDVDDWLKTQH